MYKISLFVLLLFTAQANAQSELKIYFENTGSGTNVYADNPHPIVQSAQIDFELTNLRNDSAADCVYIIPAQAQHFLLTSLYKIDDNKAYKVGTNVMYNFGNHKQKTFDKDFVYHLPYGTGKTYIIHQGYNGKFTHQGDNALDFSLAEGDQIWAARGGIVFQIIENNSRNCMSPNCEQYNNYISIVHPDGTIGEYTHLKKDGAIVNIGDTVTQGEPIGYSGKTGWTDGPHLHFEVYLQRLTTKETVKTLFKVGGSEAPIFLEEKKSYKRDY